MTRAEPWNAATLPNDPLRLTAVLIGADDRGTAYPRVSGAVGRTTKALRVLASMRAVLTTFTLTEP